MIFELQKNAVLNLNNFFNFELRNRSIGSFKFANYGYLLTGFGKNN